MSSFAIICNGPEVLSEKTHHLFAGGLIYKRRPLRIICACPYVISQSDNLWIRLQNTSVPLVTHRKRRNSSFSVIFWLNSTVLTVMRLILNAIFTFCHKIAKPEYWRRHACLSVSPSPVCLSAWQQIGLTVDGFLWYFVVHDFCAACWEKFDLNIKRIMGSLHEDLRTFI